MKSLTMSLETFLWKSKSCCGHLKSIWDSVLEGCQLFYKHEEIWPNQCNSITSLLLKLKDPLEKFCELMNFHDLPDEAIPFRYTLLLPLYCVENLIDELTWLITQFRAVCRTSSRDSMIRRQEIQRKLGEIEQGVEDILQIGDRMLNQVLAQEKSTQPLTFNIESEPQPIA
jgi:hypothetical protein